MTLDNRTTQQKRRRFLSMLGLGAIGAVLYSWFMPKSAQAMVAARHADLKKRPEESSMSVKPHEHAVKRGEVK